MIFYTRTYAMLGAVLLFCNISFSEGTHVRMYQIGNSVSDGCHMGDMVKYMVAERENTALYGKNIVLGAPLWFIWDNPGGFLMTDPSTGTPIPAWAEALQSDKYVWDALVLQPYDSDVKSDSVKVRDFLNYTLNKSPNVRCYIFAYHTAFNPGDDYSSKWLSTNQVQSRFRHESLVRALNQSYIGTGVKPIRMIPVGEVFYEIDQRIKNNQMTGITDIRQLYSDGIHMTSLGSYVTALTHYAVLYQDDPRGLKTDGWDIGAASASQIQQIVHDVIIAKSELTGISSFGPYSVAGVSLFPKSAEMNVGRTLQLSYVIRPSNASDKVVTWSSAGSAATVNNGLVTASSAGTVKIIIITHDGSFKDTCDVTVVATGTAVDGISVTPDTLKLLKDATGSFTATVAPTGATNKTLAWISLDTFVATVNSSGLVTAKAKGLTKVIAFSLNGGKTDTGVVKVGVPNRPPVPVIDCKTAIAYVPITVFMSGVKSYDPDSTATKDFVLGYDWDFGDGTNPPYITTNTAKHTYTKPGTYSIRLRVLDNNEIRSDWVTKQITIKQRDASLLAYEGFENEPGLTMLNLNGGQGFENAWDVQDNNNDINGLAVTSSVLSYPGLAAQGNVLRLNKGNNNARSFRNDTGSIFDKYLDNNSDISRKNIGKAGTTLWVSALVVKGGTSSENTAFALTRSDFWLWWGTQNILIGYLGTNCNDGILKYWGIGLHDSVYRSNVAVTPGATTLLVTKIEYTTTGTTVSLYVNPSVGTNPPSTPSLVKTTTEILSFRALSLLGGSTGSSFDEFRMGESFGSVVPGGTTKLAKPDNASLSRSANSNIRVSGDRIQLTNMRPGMTADVFNASGKQVWLTKSSNMGIITSQLPRGMYLVRLTDGKRYSLKNVVIK